MRKSLLVQVDGGSHVAHVTSPAGESPSKPCSTQAALDNSTQLGQFAMRTN